MKHHDNKRTLGRPARQYTALMRSLARSLILHEQIETTFAKAKEVQPFIERIISAGKDDTLANRRLVVSRLGARSDASQKVFTDLGPRYKERQGGYTRVVRSRVRGGDAATMAVIQLV